MSRPAPTPWARLAPGTRRVPTSWHRYFFGGADGRKRATHDTIAQDACRAPHPARHTCAPDLAYTAPRILELYAMSIAIVLPWMRQTARTITPPARATRRPSFPPRHESTDIRLDRRTSVPARPRAEIASSRRHGRRCTSYSCTLHDSFLFPDREPWSMWSLPSFSCLG